MNDSICLHRARPTRRYLISSILALASIISGCNAETDSPLIPTEEPAAVPAEPAPTTEPQTRSSNARLEGPIGDIQNALANAAGGTDPDAQPDFVDEKGERYVWVRKVPPSPPLSQDLGSPTPEQVAFQASLKSLDELTLEELADKLRTRVVHNGHEYVLARLPLDRAEKVRANVLEHTEGYRPPGIPLSPEVGGTRPEFVIDSDDRVSYDHAGISWPAMTSVKLVANNGLKCTGTIIGLRTVITAAHCLDQIVNPTTHAFSSPITALAYASDTPFPQTFVSGAVSDKLYVRSCDGVKAAINGYIFITVNHAAHQNLVATITSPDSHSYVVLNHPAARSGVWQYGIPVDLSASDRNGDWTLTITDGGTAGTNTLSSWSLYTGGSTQAYCEEVYARKGWTASDAVYTNGYFMANGAKDLRFDTAMLQFPAGTFTGWGYVGLNMSSGNRANELLNRWGYPDQRTKDNPVGQDQTSSTAPYPRLLLAQGFITNYAWGLPNYLPYVGQGSVSGGYDDGYFSPTWQAFRLSADTYNGDSGSAILSPSASEVMGVTNLHWDVWKLFSISSGPHYVNMARRWDSAAAAGLYSAPY